MPECGEIVLINVKDYKINLSECKNGHKKNNIFIDEFESTQEKDFSQICDICKEKKDVNIDILYICNSCNSKLCLSCKSIHDNNHKIINYNERNYICKKHNENYIKYCTICKNNLCKSCENFHKKKSFQK